MIKRVFVSFVLSVCLCFPLLANKEVNVKLDSKDRVYTERLGYAYITFEYLYNYGNNARVMVSVENITQNPPLAVLVFRRDIDEKNLKDGKPRILFEKNYPGEKGNLSVMGCNLDNRYRDIVTAAETDTLFTIDVPLTSARNIILPMYLAKYKPKDLFNKGKDNITYKITEQYIYDINIEVVGWSENDTTYVKIKNDVAEFISSLNGLSFCSNPKHKPSLKEQQCPYQEKKDSLIHRIRTVLENSNWLSPDDPHKAYTKLFEDLNNIDLDTYVADCGNHLVTPKVTKGHSCSFCPLSAQQIYHKLDDIYQQLHAGKISKDQALKAAKGYYNCYQHNNRRARDSSYGTKISRFYNSIANY